MNLGLGFRVEVFGFRDWCLGLGFMGTMKKLEKDSSLVSVGVIQGSGFRVSGLRFRGV